MNQNSEVLNQNTKRQMGSSELLKARAKRFLSHENAVLIIALVVLIAGFGLATKGVFVRKANMDSVMLTASITGISAIGQAFVILTSGIDLSVGGVGFFAAVFGASLMTETPWLSIVSHPFPIFEAIPIMLMLGVGLGAINGMAVSRIGLPPLIATLAMWRIGQGGGFLVSGSESITSMPQALAFLGQGRIGGVPVPLILFIVLAVIAYFVLQHTSFGRWIYAVGGNPSSAWLSGINVRKVLLIAYIISGFLAALAGVVTTSRVMSASMRTLQGLEIDTIAAVCLGGISLMGGRGNIIGAIVGVLILGVVSSGLRILGAGPELQSAIKGLIIFSAVAVDYARRR